MNEKSPHRLKTAKKENSNLSKSVEMIVINKRSDARIINKS